VSDADTSGLKGGNGVNGRRSSSSWSDKVFCSRRSMQVCMSSFGGEVSIQVLAS